MKKKFLSIILVLSMLCAFMPVIAIAETSGTCGDNVTWTLDDNGTLTISGTGDMNDYNYYSVPWYRNCSDVTNVVIKDGVTSISTYAFYDCSGLTSVTIPDSVTSIGNYAFFHCENLKNVYIASLDWWLENKSNLGSNPMSYASNIYIDGKLARNIIIPDYCTEIKSGTFSGWRCLESVTISDNVTNIGSSAFYNCSSLTSIIIIKETQIC